MRSLYLVYDIQMLTGTTHGGSRPTALALSPDEYVFGALNLYLDLLNLFLSLLRLLQAATQQQ